MSTDDGGRKDDRARGFAGLNAMASDLRDGKDPAEEKEAMRESAKGAASAGSGGAPSQPRTRPGWLQIAASLFAFAIASIFIWLVLSVWRIQEREVNRKGNESAVFLQSLEAAPKVTFNIVNMKVTETNEAAKIGKCRQFETVITIATEDAIFRHRPGSLELLVKDEASPDSGDEGKWVITSCPMLPVELDATFAYDWFSSTLTPSLPELRGGRYTAACAFSKSKGCYETSVGGDYSTGRAVERQKPQYKIRLLSWEVARGIEGSIVQ